MAKQALSFFFFTQIFLWASYLFSGFVIIICICSETHYCVAPHYHKSRGEKKHIVISYSPSSPVELTCWAQDTRIVRMKWSSEAPETWLLSFICVHYTQADSCRSCRLSFRLCLYHMHPWFHPTAYTREILTVSISYLAWWNNLCQIFCTQMKRLVKSLGREPVDARAVFQPCCAGGKAWGESGSGTASLTILAFLNWNV